MTGDIISPDRLQCSDGGCHRGLGMGKGGAAVTNAGNDETTSEEIRDRDRDCVAPFSSKLNTVTH